jgi:hypothetical protein
MKGLGLSYGPIYERLIQGAPAPVQANLEQSDSAVCFATRVAGESVSRNILASIRFQDDDVVADLTRLLTVHHWFSGGISRVTLFNPRTRQHDRPTGATRLVVADGDAAFLRILETAVFDDCDVLCVMNRTVERDRLESIGTKLTDLAQWYAPDGELLNCVPSPPRGITISALKRRTVLGDNDNTTF